MSPVGWELVATEKVMLFILESKHVSNSREGGGMKGRIWTAEMKEKIIWPDKINSSQLQETENYTGTNCAIVGIGEVWSEMGMVNIVK